MQASPLMANFLDELHDRVIIGDGATGTYLSSLGVPLESCLEETNLSNPDLVTRVYQEYADAGARLIETNTFGANAIRLARYGLEHRVNEINWTAANLLSAVVKGRDIYVGGSVGPIDRRPVDAELSVATRQHAYREQIGALLAGGCHVIFLETFTDLDDLLLALDVFQNLTNTPVVCSLAASEEGRLLNGQTFAQAFRTLRAAGADVVGMNGSCGVQATLHLLDSLELGVDDIPAVYPNAGKPEFYQGRFNYSASPEYFASNIPEFVQRGARLIGGDYGTEPRHIQAMVQAAKNLKPRLGKPRSLRVSGPTPAPPKALAEPPTEPSLLEKLKNGYVTVVELDSPKTLSMGKFCEGARALEKAGAAAITLADNSLAILRVSNFAAAMMLREQLTIPSMIHLACRDRNLLGLQSELMGLGILGFRHVLALTGDPAKAGDHPGASSVYDLNSLGLIKLMAGMNQGVNSIGKALNGKTDFLIGCAFNPNALNFDSQVKKLESKIAAGAHYVLTQPVFDRALARKTAERLNALGLPHFIGVMPILNARNAEFLHNEVPGIKIPEAVREQFRHVSEGEALDVGLKFARELQDEVRSHSKGLYLITPFLRYEVSVALLQS
jgi:methionine synthase / methylenetetrahydrofolate reductase(NADPH)